MRGSMPVSYTHLDVYKRQVNVSYLQIMDQKFFPFLEDTMERFQIPAENLLIELTETHFDEMPEHLQRFIRQCKQIGIRSVSYTHLHTAGRALETDRARAGGGRHS